MDITSQNFEEKVLSSDGLKIVDFWAPWCMPCKMLSPILEKVAEKFPQAEIFKVNVDEEPVLSIQYNISSIPALLFFKNGELIETSVGLVDEEELDNLIGENI